MTYSVIITLIIKDRWHGLAAYLPAIIHYFIHFLLTIITHVGESNLGEHGTYETLATLP